MQRASLWTGFLMGLLGGAVAGGVVASLMGAGAEPEGGPELVPAASSQEGGAWQEELDALRRQNTDLTMRLATLEGRPGEGARTPVDGFVSREEFDEFEREVRAWMNGQGALAADDPSRLRQEVEQAMHSIRTDERLQNEQAKQADREAALDKELTQMQRWLDLDAMQVQTMRSVLRARNDRNEELARLWKITPVDSESLGETKRANHELFQSEVQAVLRPDQFETYSAARPRRK